MNYYQEPISGIFKKFNTSPNGLSEKGAFFRLKKHGLNQLKKIKKTPLIFKFFNQFKDIMALILVFAGFLAFLIGEPRDSIIIFFIVFINSIIGFIQEYKAEKILAAFAKHLPSFSKIIREGKLKKILTTQLVPGDILILEPGDAIGADGRLIEAYDLKTNDFSLTGESQPQIKKVHQIKKERIVTDIDNMVFMGTSVIEGEAKAVIVKTGMETEFGKIAQQSQKVKEEPTPLQKELIHAGKATVKIAFIIVFITLSIFFLLGKGPKESFLFAIAAAVAVVPEGLPTATSIALSLGAQRMLKKKALIKNLLHVESLGSVTTICTDKTGTLTTGKMTLISTYPGLNNFPNNLKKKFYQTLILCNNATLGKRSVGDPLEVALLKFAKKQKINIAKIQKENPRFFEIPFSSKEKMMTVVCKTNGNYYVYTKGATLEILELCKLTQKEKKAIIENNDKMARSGLKVLALAYKNLGKKKDFKKKEIEKKLIFLGLVGLEDPPREGVTEAIRLCKKAQIRTIMITGDQGLTALAIAKQIGLSSNKTEAITGFKLHHSDDEKLKNILKKDVIFARIDPGQKLRIVKNLQEIKEVVAVTGDGVNDAPALVKADIGVAMGKIGTDVAKEAADMILLDDHFATIVNAVKEGRRIFDNARKFVFYIFSSNSGELFVALFGVILGLPLPLIAIQILAIDLGTDVLPSLALGTEKEEPDIMETLPRSKTERVMSGKMISRLFFVGLTMASLSLLVYIFALYEGGWHYGSPLDTNNNLYFTATASAYAALVFSQIANAFSCRSDKVSISKLGFLTNHSLIYAEIISLALLLGIINFAPLQNIFRTASPSLATWFFVFLSFFIFLGLSEWWKKKFILKNQKAS